MSDGKDPGHGGGEAGQKYFYFVDDTKYENATSSVTGAEIRARIPNLAPNVQLIQEGHAGQPDTVVQPSTVINLAREGEGVPRLYTAPPATFGNA